VVPAFAPSASADFWRKPLRNRVQRVARACLSLAPGDLVAAIQNAVQTFSFGEQSDDLTMVIARAR